MKGKILTVLLLTSIITAPLNVLGEDEETFTLSGFVFTNNGDLANKTSIKVGSMTSTWSENGSYTFTGITPGEHTVRAYFMNDGHSVVYRKMFFSQDMELNWYVGMNWVTAEIFNENGEYINNNEEVVIKIIENKEVKTPNDGRFVSDLLEIGKYYTIETSFQSPSISKQYLHFKLEAGSATFPDLNDFDINYGENSKYGFIYNSEGTPLPNVVVSNGINEVITNSDGFYLMQNLEVGSSQTFTFKQYGEEIIDPINNIISNEPGWLNLTSDVKINLPENVSFTSSIQTITISEVFLIEWDGGNFTDYYSLYLEDDLIYKGPYESYIFYGEEAGTYEFEIRAENTNGTTKSNLFILIVLPKQANEDLWSVGMSWNYSLVHTPEYHQNKTYTAIGSEIITDAFGQERETFLVRVSDDTYGEGEKAYHWIDADNLLDVKTYWADAPSSSSYYQEGVLGWLFTDNNDEEVSIFAKNGPTKLHFNRTNIIGVPGHPNGYDDTKNNISITENVVVETPAGSFLTTHYKITDENDGVISWELWYNETVRNWVKKVDRLPGSHSDTVIFELTAFEVPMSPQFITESGDVKVENFVVEWGVFQGATSYQLFENNMLIYEGNKTIFEIENKKDGEYTYQINAIMNSGQIIEGDTLFLDVNFVLEPPIISASSRTIVENEKVVLSWQEIENVAWYSIKVENSEGVVIEFYNGTDNVIEINSFELGQNRIRLQAALQNGKVSELSPSIFVTVEDLIENEDVGQGVPAIGIHSTILAISLAVIIKKRRGENE